MNWTTIQNAIHDWFETATGITAIWADQNAPEPGYPYATLNIISGPIKVGMDELVQSEDLTRAGNVKVTPVAHDATTYTDTINGTAYSYLSGAGATVAEICAGLVAAITAGSQPVTATDHGTYYTVETNEAGEIFTLVVDANQTWVNVDLGHEIEFKAAGPRTMTVSCQVMGEGALGYITLAQQALSLPSVLAALLAAGLGVIEAGPITNITAIANARRLSRHSMDVRFALGSEIAEQTGYIQTTEVTSDFGTIDPDLQLDHEIIGD
jgi:hypothetical protein